MTTLQGHLSEDEWQPLCRLAEQHQRPPDERAREG